MVEPTLKHNLNFSILRFNSVGWSSICDLMDTWLGGGNASCFESVVDVIPQNLVGFKQRNLELDLDFDDFDQHTKRHKQQQDFGISSRKMSQRCGLLTNIGWPSIQNMARTCCRIHAVSSDPSWQCRISNWRGSSLQLGCSLWTACCDLKVLAVNYLASKNGENCDHPVKQTQISS